MGVADRVEAGRATGGNDGSGPAGTVAPGDLRAQMRGNQRLVEERHAVGGIDEPVPAVLADHDVLVLEPGGGADRGTEHDTQAGPVDAARVQLRVLDGLGRGRE